MNDSFTSNLSDIDSDDAEQRRLDSRLEEQRVLAQDDICFVGLDAEQL